MSSKQGVFLTLEGGEGVGKTTNIEVIKGWMRDRGIDFVATREPGGTDFAESIRALLLENREEKVDDVAELLLIFAARAQHLSQVIVPALKAGKWVLCDRFTDATYAYQGAGRELGFEKIAALETMVQGQLRPDITLILDVPVDVGLSRATQRSELDRFEREQVAFFERVRRCYLERAKQNPARYRVIDAAVPLDKVKATLLNTLDQCFERLDQ
ncbi:MAG: dTMP kinase [bacterium]